MTVDQVASNVSQKELSRRIDMVAYDSFKESISDVTDKARVSSLGLKHSGDWLYVVPCPALGLHMKGREFRIAALYRLGMSVFQARGPCVACTVADSDQQGNHGISCPSQGERIARHNHLHDAVFATAASAHLAPTKEERALLPGTEGRPADVLVPNLLGGMVSMLHWT